MLVVGIVRQLSVETSAGFYATAMKNLGAPTRCFVHAKSTSTSSSGMQEVAFYFSSAMAGIRFKDSERNLKLFRPPKRRQQSGLFRFASVSNFSFPSGLEKKHQDFKSPSKPKVSWVV